MKRSPWRYLWSAQDIRRKLLITLGILIDLSSGCACAGSGCKS